MFPKALRITYSKIHGFIKVYGEISYLVLFVIGFNILYVKKVLLKIVLIITFQESRIIYQLEEILTFHSVIILIK